MNRDKTNPSLSSKKKNHRAKSVKKNSRRRPKSLSATNSSVKSHSKTKPLAETKQDREVRLSKRKRQLQTNFIPTPVAFLCRLTIIAVGISTIVGTVVTVATSINNEVAIKNSTPTTQIVPQTRSRQSQAVARSRFTRRASRSPELENLFSLVAIGQEIIPLKKQLQTLTQKYPQLEAGILIADIEDKSYVNLGGTDTFSSASTIKLPILVAFFQDVDAGKIELDELLTITEENISGGSGYLQYQPVGKKITALKAVTDMIAVSDNTATNMAIERLGGATALNQRFVDWGLNATKIRNPLPDLEGTNTTSPEDLSNLLLKIDRGQLVSSRSQKRILQIMQQTQRNHLLPQGLGQGATIAHKTGDLLSVLGDTGTIDLPNGKSYIASVLVKRPDNDPQAESLIREISRTTYEYFRQQSQSQNLPKTSSFVE